MSNQEFNPLAKATKNVHFSSDTDQWATPMDVFEKLNSIFDFQTDVCAGKDNAKCEVYYDEDIDGLKQEWTGVCWMNPPIRPRHY